MAINENLIGEVRPNESAVDRLRKRNRIRPWESDLVGAKTKSKSQSEGVDTSPSGQTTQRVDEPEGKDSKNEPSGIANPVGIPPSGPSTHSVRNSVGGTSTPPETKTTSPLGKLPPGPGVQGDVRTGSNASEGGHPVGELPMLVAQFSDTPVYPAQRVIDPVVSLPIGQNPAEPCFQPTIGFDPTAFVPADKGAVLWREKGSGELRIPHRLYEFAHRVTSTRNELLVFDCLLRFSLGFHRSWCEAGYSFIAAWTGISDVTNIKKSLKTLIAAGIIVKAKEHNSTSNTGTIYDLPVVKGYLEYVATKNEHSPAEQPEKQPMGNIPSGQLAPGSAVPPTGGQKTYGPVGVLPPKKENLNKTSKKILSQERSADLDAYVDQIKPAAKRESEIYFLGKLLSEYSPYDVALALRYTRQFGVLGSKEKCHSPLNYLCSAIEQVLPKAREYEILLRRTDSTSPEPTFPQDSMDMDREQSRFRIAALAAFETELSRADRDKYIAEATNDNSVTGYAPPATVLRNIAAIRWFETEREDRGHVIEKP